MPTNMATQEGPLAHVVKATGEPTVFAPGDRVRVSNRRPIGHYRVPFYLRGKTAIVESIFLPVQLNNEEEAFGRNAGGKRHYYRIGLPMRDIWPTYSGSDRDTLRIEVFETWLEEVAP